MSPSRSTPQERHPANLQPLGHSPPHHNGDFRATASSHNQAEPLRREHGVISWKRSTLAESRPHRFGEIASSRHHHGATTRAPRSRRKAPSRRQAADNQAEPLRREHRVISWKRSTLAGSCPHRSGEIASSRQPHSHHESGTKPPRSTIEKTSGRTHRIGLLHHGWSVVGNKNGEFEASPSAGGVERRSGREKIWSGG